MRCNLLNSYMKEQHLLHTCFANEWMNIKCLAILHPQQTHYYIVKKGVYYAVDLAEKKGEENI